MLFTCTSVVLLHKCPDDLKTHPRGLAPVSLATQNVLVPSLSSRLSRVSSVQVFLLRPILPINLSMHR